MTGEATRIFAGPSDFPPEDFGAYAIIAFKSTPSSDNRDLFNMICDAYRASIPEVHEELPLSNQLVTVWPVANDDTAREIMEAAPSDQCGAAVDSYGLLTARRALADARRASPQFDAEFRSRRGPFLIAWNPASSKGDEDLIILRMDLSDVQLPYQARRRFQLWVTEIEGNPDLWVDDWQRVGFLDWAQEALDNWGPRILSFMR